MLERQVVDPRHRRDRDRSAPSRTTDRRHGLAPGRRPGLVALVVDPRPGEDDEGRHGQPGVEDGRILLPDRTQDAEVVRAGEVRADPPIAADAHHRQGGPLHVGGDLERIRQERAKHAEELLDAHALEVRRGQSLLGRVPVHRRCQRGHTAVDEDRGAEGRRVPRCELERHHGSP